MDWYIFALNKYAVFRGRARRKEYWCFMIISALVSLIMVYFDIVLGSYYQEIKLGVLQAVYYVVVLLPTLAVTVRRLHDCNRSGWWILISILPVVGILVLFVLLLQEGNIVVNRFGSAPKIDYLI